MPTGSREPGALTHEVTRLIAGRMAAHGLSQATVADRAGIPRPSLVKILKGQAAVDLEQLGKLCGALEYPMHELIEDAGA